MATKLDKNFGLGNSYKNVKLVKSGIKKSDSNTEKLIEELKNVTLPVYEISYDTKVSESNITAPCILILTSDNDKFINICDRFNKREIGYFFLDSTDNIFSYFSSYDENDTFKDVEEHYITYATEEYVKQNYVKKPTIYTSTNTFNSNPLPDTSQLTLYSTSVPSSIVQELITNVGVGKKVKIISAKGEGSGPGIDYVFIGGTVYTIPQSDPGYGHPEIQYLYKIRSSSFNVLTFSNIVFEVLED